MFKIANQSIYYLTTNASEAHIGKIDLTGTVILSMKITSTFYIRTDVFPQWIQTILQMDNSIYFVN